MRYAFIQASLEDSELKDIPIAKRCEVLEVSVSGYHAWVKRQRMPVKCRKVISDETVLRQAKIIRNEMKYTPGYRQMHALMRQRGVCSGVKRLRGVLRVNGIIGYRHFKRTVKTTDSNHNMFVYPNLLGRDFAPGTLNRAWVSDITYLPTTQGWGFLATILDLGSRRILGWAMDTSMTTDLVLRALNMAVRTRGSNAVAGTIMHSDRGTQYCSAAFQNRLMQLPSLSKYFLIVNQEGTETDKWVAPILSKRKIKSSEESFQKKSQSHRRTASMGLQKAVCTTG